MAGTKTYFLSDFHLGAPNEQLSKQREKHICSFLDSIKNDASAIYLVGDVFDFWFEYKHAIPKGFVRLQGKIAELTDYGIKVYWFIGNHDMWIFDYIPNELGVELIKKPVSIQLGNKKIYIGHGDGLGPGDHGYKFIKKVFANKFCQWLFARIHPNLGIGIAQYWSRKSRKVNQTKDLVFEGEDKEWLVQYCKEVLATEHFDYFIFGHRHLPLNIQLKPNSHYINLGDWISHYSYAVFENDTVELKEFKPSF
ncbi:MAG: UDP-2,3-diacylglucosamine diphosphatase [Vicingaceae bacterium]